MSRIKILVLMLSLSAIGASLFSLEYITNKLLEGEASMVGMRWAEDIDSSLNNLDKIFAGQPEQSNAPEVLHQLSSIGLIYRYAFSDLDGKIVFDTNSELILAQHGAHQHQLSLRKSIIDHGRHELSGLKTSGVLRGEQQHVVILGRGDGQEHPRFYAYIVHPISRDGKHLGNLSLYIDQTETQAFLRHIMYVLLIVMSCVVVFAFGLPAFLYLRSNGREKSQQSHFDATLSIMHQGICIFDDSDNVIVANDCFATIYDLPQGLIKPGMKLSQLIEMRIENGCYIGQTADEYHEKINHLKTIKTGVPQTHRLNDGRYVEIYNLPIAKGGWLTIHEDVTERTVVQQEISYQNEKFDVAISNISQGLCLFDEDQKLIVSNDRFATIFDLSPDVITPGMGFYRILELRRQYGSFVDETYEDLLERIETWSNISSDVTETFELTNGKFIEIFTHPMKGSGWLATMEDVTERTQSKHAIALQNKHFDVAISNISQGLCMFDGDRKLIVSNDQYATMFDLTPDMIKPGMHILEIMEARVTHGSYIDEGIGAIRTRVDEWATRAAEQTEIYLLSNGRSIKILSHPMGDGGWLATMEDITDRLAAEEEFLQRSERLDVALETMTQGLCLLDDDMNIIISNDQYAELYGIPPALIKPGTNIREVVELRIERDTYAGSSPDTYRQERMNAFGDRDDSVKIHHLKNGRYIEIRKHAMSNGGWLAMHEDVTDRLVSEQKIKRLADFDTLTGLPNRLQIHNILSVATQQALESELKMALLYIDLDGFKEINDTLGHPVGDQLLKEIGQRLAEFAGDTIVAGRLSGDEFVMIVREYDYPPYLNRLGAKICETLAEPIHVGTNVIELSASIGIAMGPPVDGEVDTLVQFADLALYQSKADGGNRYHFFEEKMYAQAKDRQRITKDLRMAIRNNELVLHYQPIIDMHSGKIECYEALVRWQHSEFEMIPPLDFIGVAEETGQICEIGEWVLKTACEYAATWPNKEKVSVNLSTIQFKRQDIATMVKRVLWETGFEPERLELEITESALIQNTDSVIAALETLSEMGVSIALDDFGTGFSSLSYLTMFPFNKIKIDKCFIDELGKNSGGTAIVAMIIGLGRNLDAVIVAEGIEDSRQHEILSASGCDQGQGYLYGKPLPKILQVDELKLVNQA